MFSRRVGSGRESLPVNWVWSQCPSCWPGVVWRPFQRAGSGREALPVGRVWS